MTDSRARVAFLGPAGTFSQAAAEKHFGTGAEFLGQASIDTVFEAVEDRRADYGVVPVENSTEGAVNYTQDCLIDTTLTIVAEVVIAIEHNLLLRDPAQAADIQRIVSHRQSLAQCRLWLKANWPGVSQVEVSSNGEAARLAADDPRTAAIASASAAANYGLQIQARGIQDRIRNFTRFLILSRTVPESRTRPSGFDKTSIIAYTENRPGALFHILEPFERQQVSLTKIETRPDPDAVWAYLFFIDFEGHADDDSVRAVFAQLEQSGVRLKTLGSYPRAVVDRANAGESALVDAVDLPPGTRSGVPSR